MNIKRRHFKVFTIISTLILAAVLVTACAANPLQQQGGHSQGSRIDISRDAIPIQPESAQTGPTGNLAIITGIILLMVGLGVLVLILTLVVRHKFLNPA